MIKQILIEEGSFSEIEEKAKNLCLELKKDIKIISSSKPVYDRFINKHYRIYALCENITDERDIKRIQLFLESFSIDYQYKLLERNFPDILMYETNEKTLSILE